MSNCFSVINTSTSHTLLLSCGDGDEGTELLQKWMVAIALGIENQGGTADVQQRQQQQQQQQQEQCLWQGWTYKKGALNTAWKKRYMRLTAAAVTCVDEWPLAAAKCVTFAAVAMHRGWSCINL